MVEVNVCNKKSLLLLLSFLNWTIQRCLLFSIQRFSDEVELFNFRVYVVTYNVAETDPPESFVKLLSLDVKELPNLYAVGWVIIAVHLTKTSTLFCYSYCFLPLNLVHLLTLEVTNGNSHSAHILELITSIALKNHYITNNHPRNINEIS